jgi:hypothetical protein
MRKVIWFLIFVFLIYSGVKFGMPYYRYLAFKSDIKEITGISIGLHNEEEIRNRVFERAEELKIPINKEDIELSVTPTMVRIQTSWVEVVDMLGIYQKTLTFSVDSEG